MACALAISPGVAAAQSFPQPGKQIRLVVPFPAGGQADFQARLIAPRLSAALAVPVIVDNKPGASSIIGVQDVARASPDGYTLLYTIASPIVANPHMFAKLPYDALRDFAPLTLAAITAQVLVAHASVPAKNIKELVAHAKANPGKLNFGSYGLGTSSHIYGELLKSNAGIEMVHVPYKGAADATKDLVAGRVELVFMALTAALPHIQAGSLKVLGVVGDKRLPSMPEAPTIAEQGVAGLELAGWLGIFAPANTPPAVLERLNAEIVKVLRLPDIVERFRQGGSEAAGTSPREFDALVRNDHARWGEVIRRFGIKLD
jgi:tripartite-type tricarboxylate transporter receptor subunit TctC